jgi:tape measure domain-containing protein
MPDDSERLVVAIEARISQFEKNMLAAERRGTQSFGALRKASRSATRQMETDMLRSSTRINQALAQSSARIGTFGKAFAAGLIPAASIGGFSKLLDASTKVNNALKIAGLSGQELKQTYDSLFASAQKNGAPLEALVTLYSRASASAKELNASQADLRNFTDKVAVALRASGQSAEESAGALLQLSQALGNGTVQAEEYGSLLDGGRPILQATAAGLKEAGGSVSALTKLVKEGKVSSEAFFRAFLAGAPTLESAVASSESTISQRMTRLQNVLIDAAGRFNESAKAAETFGSAIDGAADVINGIDFNAVISQIESITGSLSKAITMTIGLYTELGRLSGLSNVGKGILGSLPGGTVKSYLGGGVRVYSTDAVQDRVAGAFDVTSGGAAGGLTADAIRNSVNSSGPLTTPKGGRLPAAPAVKPVSLSDYALPTSSKAGGGAGGGRKSADEYAREVQQIKERTAAITAETAAQAGLDPLIEDYGAASARASTAADLLSAAQKAGTAAGKELSDVSQLLAGNFDGLSPAARQQAEAMLALADGYSKAEAESRKLAASQDEAREKAQQWNDLGRDVTKGFISDLRSGTSAADALTNALGRIADTLLDQMVDALFATNKAATGSGGGLFAGLGGLLGSIFSFEGGGSTGSGSRTGGVDGRGGFPAILHPDETIIDHTKQRTGQAPAAAGGSTAVHVSVDSVVRFEEDGTFHAYVEKTSATQADRRVRHYDAALPGRVDAINRQPRRRKSPN